MKDVFELARQLNDLIGHKESTISSPHVCPNPPFHYPSCLDLVEGRLYLFVPEAGLQRVVRNEIQKYASKTGKPFIITTSKCCPGNHECYGHYVDPFTGEDNHRFIDSFPGNINGSSVHFLVKEAYEKLVAEKQ